MVEKTEEAARGSQGLHVACDLMARKMEHELSCLPAANHVYSTAFSQSQTGLENELWHFGHWPLSVTIFHCSNSCDD